MTTEQIIPMGEYVLIGPCTDPNQSGMLIKLTNRVDNRGIVLAVGDKVNTDKDSTKLEVGQTVIYIPGSGIKLSNSEDSAELISIKNVIGIIKGE